MPSSIGTKKIRIAVFISGNGSNFKNLIIHSLKKKSKFQINLVLSSIRKKRSIENFKAERLI